MKELVIGEEYFYWNKRYGEKVATRKPCRLQAIEGNMVRVVRLDLEINRVQVIAKSRLIVNSVGSNQYKTKRGNEDEQTKLFD